METINQKSITIFLFADHNLIYQFFWRNYSKNIDYKQNDYLEKNTENTYRELKC